MHLSRKGLIGVLSLLSLLVFLSVSEIPSKLMLSSSGTIISSSGTISLDWLRTNGKWIVNSEGKTVILRGSNVHDVLYEPRTEEDYEKMKSWGFNVVRLPIAWHSIETQPGIYDFAYIHAIDEEITLAKKNGIYIILDLHQWEWSPYFTFFGGKGYGMPVWLVSGYPNTEDGLGDSITDFWLGKGVNGTEVSETNPSMQDFYIDVWRFLAERYQNESAIAIYELFNEPYHSRIIPACDMPSYLFPFYSRLIERIREVDPKHIIAYQPTGGWDSGRAEQLNYSNLAYTFHYYHTEVYDGNATELRSGFMYRYAPPYTWQSKPPTWNLPIYLGEFGIGAGSYNPNASKYVQHYMEILNNEIEIGWMWWIYGKSDTYTKELLYANGTEKTELTCYLKITL